MRDREIALGIGPAPKPTLPIAIDPARRVTAPLACDAAVFDAKMLDIAPDRACQIGVGRGDDDLAFLAHFGAAPRHALAAIPRVGRIPARCLGILDPHIADDPRQRISMRIGP